MLALAGGIGLLVGVVVGALGAGGGILSVPVLVYLLGQEAHAAAASSLFIVGATAAVSLPHHARSHNVDWRRGGLFAVFSIIGSVLGSRVSVLVPEVWLMGSFAVLLTVVGVVMVRKGLRGRREEAGGQPGESGGEGGEKGLPAVGAAALLTGFLTGFFGVGGGFIVVPMLVLVLGLGMRRASGTSLLVMVVTAVSGLLARIGTPVEVDWLLTVVFAAGSMVGGVLGGPLSARVRPWVLTTVFGVLLLVVALYTGVQNLS